MRCGANEKWQIANEPFMEDCTWLNRLNLRMTYGVGCNDRDV